MLGAYRWLLWMTPVGRWGCIPSDWFKAVAGVGLFLSHMAPALVPKALKRVGISAVGCTLMPSVSPLAVLSLFSTYCGPYIMACRCAVVWGGMSKTGPAVMGAGVARSTHVCPSPLMASLAGAIWGAGWAAALPCPGQGSHHFGNLLTQFYAALS